MSESLAHQTKQLMISKAMYLLVLVERVHVDWRLVGVLDREQIGHQGLTRFRRGDL